MTKLKYYIEKAKKIYTINQEKGKTLKDAHYKFVKIRNAPTNSNKVTTPS